MNRRRAPDQAAFLLHARPYREHHHLLELFTARHGRLTVVGTGPRPELFRLLKVRISGQQELKQLGDWVYQQPAFVHEGSALLLGLYVNELCARLLPRFVEDEALFGTYASTLLQLPAGSERALSALRFFEKRLLEGLGFGIDYRRAMDSGQWIQSGHIYRFDPQLGFCQWGRDLLVPGEVILHMAADDWQQSDAQYFGGWVHWQRMQSLLEARRFLSHGWLVDVGLFQAPPKPVSP